MDAVSDGAGSGFAIASGGIYSGLPGPFVEEEIKGGIPMSDGPEGCDPGWRSVRTVRGASGLSASGLDWISEEVGR